MPALGSIFVFYIPPLALAKIVNLGTTKASSYELSTYLPYIALFAGSWLAGEAMWRIGMHFAIKAEVAAVRKLYINGLANILKRDLSFFHDNFAGSLTKRTISYANRYIDVADLMIFDVFTKLIPVLFAMIVLAFYSPWLTLCLIGWLGLSIHQIS